LHENAGTNFLQHLANLKFDQLVAKDENDKETVKKIEKWFELFLDLLQNIFEDNSLTLEFDKKTYNYSIIQKNHNPFNFTQLSDGYSAIFTMISEIMMRMEKHKTKIYDLQGIVLIDEIETHLHIDLQKKILPFLTSVFPNIQFIVTTHSPFVLSSDENAVIFDLEKNILVENMSGYSLDSIVENYYDSDKYSQIVKNQIAEFERLFNKKSLSEDEEERLVELKIYFKDLPKFLAPELLVKLQQIQSSKIKAK
jgi:predicted ATP-binding protein involved in virulence